MSFNMECISAQWHEDSAKWKAIVRDIKSREERSIWADVFVYAVGRLNNYKIPEIVGQDRFRGKQVHTANWPSDLKVRDRRIVIIGNGASAVQCTAELQRGS
jgi:cation diffusion facilitator CzcD-associated flavoprotein CzcO